MELGIICLPSRKNIHNLANTCQSLVQHNANFGEGVGWPTVLQHRIAHRASLLPQIITFKQTLPPPFGAFLCVTRTNTNGNSARLRQCACFTRENTRAKIKSSQSQSAYAHEFRGSIRPAGRSPVLDARNTVTKINNRSYTSISTPIFRALCRVVA